MLQLKKVDAKNVRDLLALKVTDEQRHFVSSNNTSIIDAYLSLSVGGHAYPFGIYDDDTPVGFLMIGYDTDEYWEDPPEIAHGNYALWRIMIDERYQKRGYGRRAIELALDFIRTFPCGDAEYCYLAYEPDNEVAKRLYHSMGFFENGQMDGCEIVAALKL